MLLISAREKKSHRLSIAGLSLIAGMACTAVSADYNSFSSVSTKVETFGVPTKYGQRLFEGTPNENGFTILNGGVSQPYVYINAKKPLNKNELDKIESMLKKGSIAIIDNIGGNTKDMRQLSYKLGGIGVDSPIVFMRKSSNGIPEYKELIIADNNGKPAKITSDITVKQLNKLVTESTGMIERMAKTEPTKTNRSKSKDHYRPEVSIPVEMRYTSFPCMVGSVFNGNGVTGSWYWDDELIDGCDGNASVSIYYTVDLIRSVPSTTGSSDDAKYVRITVDPSSNGGAGWHLADHPTHKHTWFQSWTNREEWFGPIADSYFVDITSKDSDVHLFNTVPSNQPKESQIMQTTGLQIGVSGGPSLFGPNTAGNFGFGGITPGISFTYSSERAITYNNHEYELTNRSRAGETDKASWIWSREFEKYATNWRVQRTCELWCQDWFYDDVAFSASSYANFTPGFSATFQAPGDKQGTSVITFENAIKTVALGGRVQYAFLFQHYTPWGMMGSIYNFKQDLTINWSSSFFNAEIPVSIEAFKEKSENGICLEASNYANEDEDGIDVSAEDCTFEQNQIWGYDSEYRYKSFLYDGQCLNLESDNTLKLRNCNYSANQKWDWKKNHLINNAGALSLSLKGGQLVATSNVRNGTEWMNFIRKSDIKGIMDISALSTSVKSPVYTIKVDEEKKALLDEEEAKANAEAEAEAEAEANANAEIEYNRADNQLDETIKIDDDIAYMDDTDYADDSTEIKIDQVYYQAKDTNIESRNTCPISSVDAPNCNDMLSLCCGFAGEKKNSAFNIMPNLSNKIDNAKHVEAFTPTNTKKRLQLRNKDITEQTESTDQNEITEQVELTEQTELTTNQNEITEQIELTEQTEELVKVEQS